METLLKLILECLYCLLALCACGFFVSMIYTDIKKGQRDEEMDRRREEREEEYHRKRRASIQK